jgi:DNA-binding FadR family transcriptional regulator
VLHLKQLLEAAGKIVHSDSSQQTPHFHAQLVNSIKKGEDKAIKSAIHQVTEQSIDFVYPF